MTKADKIFERKMKFINGAVARMDKNVVAFQRKLFDLIVAEYLPQFDQKDGMILDTPKNDNLVGRLDRIFDRLEDALQKDVLSVFVNNILQSTKLSAEYYVALGFKKTVVNNILKNKVNLESKLGITPKGRLKKDGYLFQLGKTQEARQDLKRYVLRALTGDTSFLDFQLGFKNLVMGSPKGRKKGVATTGRLQRYFDQYAYDSFNQLDETANRQFAQGLNLEHMVYEGSLIDTSRRVCEKWAGKAFVVKDWVKMAKADPDVIDQKTISTYNPLIERGRYRCRHFIKYITKTIYEALK